MLLKIYLFCPNVDDSIVIDTSKLVEHRAQIEEAVAEELEFIELSCETITKELMAAQAPVPNHHIPRLDVYGS